MAAGAFPKDPAESFPVGIDLTRRLPAGRTVSRATLSAIDLADNSSAASVLLSASASVSGQVLYATVRAGTLGHRYRIIFDIYDNANSHYRQSLTMVVRAA